MIIKIENIKLTTPNEIVIPNDWKDIEHIVNSNHISDSRNLDSLKAYQIYVRSLIAMAKGYEFTFDCSAVGYSMDDSTIDKLEMQDWYADVFDELYDEDAPYVRLPKDMVIFVYPRLIVINTEHCTYLSDIEQQYLQDKNMTVGQLLEAMSNHVLDEYLPIYIDFK